MARLSIGLILLSVYCYGQRYKRVSTDVKPPTWPRGYEYRGIVKSLTHDLEETYRAYISDRTGKIRIFVNARGKSPSLPGDWIFAERKEKHDSVRRYFPSFSGTIGALSRSCVEHNAHKGFSDAYRLPALSNPELKYKCTWISINGNCTIEQWERSVKVGKYFHIQEKVWIRYRKSDQDKRHAIPVGRDYTEFTVPGGMVSVHKTYRYDYYITKEPDPSALFNRINDQLLTYDNYLMNNLVPYQTEAEYHNTTCKKQEFAYLLQDSDSKDPDEFSKRHKLFNERMKMVKEHNQKDSPYKLELNSFAYMMDDELKAYASCNDASKVDMSNFEHVEVGNAGDHPATLPESIDWRLQGAVTPVKYQGHCGSCWAFAVAGAMESFHYVKSKEKELPVLSEQMLMDCMWNLNGTEGLGSRGCYGGNLQDAFEWISEFGGMKRSIDYNPYIGVNGYCDYKPSHLIPLTKFKFLETPEQIKMALVQHGPVAVYIRADREFMFYKSGIYKPKDDTFTSHAALLVGYGTLNGQKYWLIKNSWGTAWGEAGYMTLSYNSDPKGAIKYGFVPVS